MRYHSAIVTPGSRFGAYEIGPLLGAGGMGEVYRARDTRLQRDVALKILPDSFAADPERLARFTREAQTIAALNHPHIAQVFGLEDSGPSRALAMELVEGDTLAQRIATGPLPIEEALPIARQIADALESAHAKGIIHRDLKPANIMLTRDSQVKVLDFGLAKALESAASSDVANSPTLTLQATQAGVILGTAAYMSPEQARGRSVDKRSDVWSFGCVLFEMLAGRRAFDGEDVTETIAAVVRAEPDWTLLPAGVSAQIRLLLKRCLEKDPRARVSDIAVARFLMTESIVTSTPPAVAVPQWRHVARLAAVAIVAAVAAGAGVWAWLRPSPAASAVPLRFTVTPPANQPLAIFSFNRDITIAPDGSAIVYRSGPTQAAMMTVRPLGSLESRRIEGSLGRDPFMSPDGRWIGYFTTTDLRKVSITGGAPVTLARNGANARGGSWGLDDRIVFALINQDTDGLMSVSASGGPVTTLTHRDPAKREGQHWDPSVLPNGRGILYAIVPLNPAPPETAQIAVLDLRTGQSKTIIRGGLAPTYVSTGHIVYAAARGLSAVPFDAERLELTGDPVPVLDRVMVGPTGAANFAISRGGTLVYVPEAAAGGEPQRRLVWVSREGQEEALPAPVRGYGMPRISPDGSRIAVELRDGRNTTDIWIWDLARRTLTPIGLDPAQDMSPVWTLDSRRVVWTSTRSGGNPNLFWQAADGTGSVSRLSTDGPAQFPTAITPDGSRVLVFSGNAVDPEITSHIGMVPLDSSSDGNKQPETLISSAGDKANATVSPDGKWIAFQSNESGQHQVYVRPYPNVDAGRTQISTSGGTRPAWAPNGRELFYLDEDDLLTAVSIRVTANTFQAGVPVTILKTKYYAGLSTRGLPLRSYDVSPDGRRFLMVKETSLDVATGNQPSMVVVLNWFDELKAKFASK